MNSKTNASIKLSKEFWERYDNIISDPQFQLKNIDRSKRNKIYFFCSGQYRSYKYKVLNFLKIAYPKIDVDRLKLVMEEYILLYTRLALEEGPLGACQTLHKVYGVCQRYSVSSKFDKIPFRKSFKDGLPKMVSFARDLLRGSFSERRAVLVLLESYSLIDNKVDSVNTESITLPDSIPNRTFNEMTLTRENYFYRKIRLNRKFRNSLPLALFAREWDKILEIEFPEKQKEERIQILENSNQIVTSSKNGPNGQATLSLPLDWITLDEGLKFHLKYILAFTRNNEILEILSQWDDFMSNNPIELSETKSSNNNQKDIDLVPSRLRIKSEPGGKGRLFAIVDGLTQNALSGLHSQIYKWLKSAPEDGTASHNYVAMIAKQWSSIPGVESFSKDLSKASDRLPVDCQFDVQRKKYGNMFAANWREILVNRKYRLSLKESDDDLVYQKGQPMGAKSSWPAMAEMHHLIARTCQRMVNLRRVVTTSKNENYAQYLIIGDDFSTRSKELSDLYSYIMTVVLECDISPRKGFGPDQYDPELNPLKDIENSSQVIEMAKRIFAGGKELTSVSPVQILDGLSYPDCFPELLRVLNDRQVLDREDQFPAPILASLHDKCKLALLTATLPIGPAPLTGVTEFLQGDITEKNTYLNDLVWFRHHPESTSLSIQKSKEFLRKSLQDAISSFYTKTNNFLSFEDGIGDLALANRLIPRTWYLLLFDKIYQSAQKRITDILLENSTERPNLSKKLLWDQNTDDLNGSLFKREIGRLQGILELEKLLDKIEDPKGRRLDEKKFSSDAILKIVRHLRVDLLNKYNIQ